MTRVDLLVNDPLLTEELRAAVSRKGVSVTDAEGEVAALTGAEIDHIIQIVFDGLAFEVLKYVTLRMKDVLTGYYRRATGFRVVVDGIRYNVASENDIDSVLTAVAEAYERSSLPKRGGKSG
jgi:ActR/RegA family two-component response regulator